MLLQQILSEYPNMSGPSSYIKPPKVPAAKSVPRMGERRQLHGSLTEGLSASGLLQHLIDMHREKSLATSPIPEPDRLPTDTGVSSVSASGEARSLLSSASSHCDSSCSSASTSSAESGSCVWSDDDSICSFDLGFIDDEDASSNGPSDDEYVFVEDDAAKSTDEDSSSEADEDEDVQLDSADDLLECGNLRGRRIGQGAERSR